MRPSSLLALGTLLLAAGSAARARADAPGLPSVPLPRNHPCRIPDESFTPFYEKDGVAIRTHPLGSGRAVVRSAAEIPAPPETVAKFLADVGAWSAWVKRLRSSARVGGEPPAFHLSYHAPWPFSDRDYGLAPSLSRDAEGHLVLWWESAADRLAPPLHGVIRVREIEGGLVLLPGTGEGATRVVYSDVAVLGGRLPGWAIRESWRRGPVGILGALRRHFEEEAERGPPPGLP